ncbi:YheU family protein [Bdellovibrio sp. HCB2-146]|uniref:YheU family protein n=1 Tax=Bdellovibrio sp. HCB2-146 TaxID=3394362 RepID=UPI0039BD1C62
MRDHQQKPQPPLEIPLEALSEDALNGIIENFIQREGTDYGANEIALETKMQQIRKQLQRGDVKVVFDPDSESVTLLTKNEWNKLSKVSPAAAED